MKISITQENYIFIRLMKKAKIYKPTKTAMQSGLGKNDKWIIEYITKKPGINPQWGGRVQLTLCQN